MRQDNPLNEEALVNYLLSPAAVRDQCGRIFELVQQKQSAHFRYHPDKLSTVADYVLAVTKSAYPTLEIPYHSRWRHFDVGQVDRVGQLQQQWGQVDAVEQGRRLYELVITSVLLDAGAGEQWHYHEAATEQIFTRSEGLAVASFDLYGQGGFSSDLDQPFLADAIGLAQFTPDKLAQGFQVSDDNPLLGLAGRSQLITRLGQIVSHLPAIFGEQQPRLGHLFDYFLTMADAENRLSAVAMLQTILHTFGSVWPGRLQLGAVNLGDCWQHPALQTAPNSAGYIPFHKLSQWLTYSLLEPLQAAGITITELPNLTGLAEYRNGGLLLDLGLISLRDEAALTQTHAVDSLLIVEWRALTVAILDQVAVAVRNHLNLTAEAFPLAKVLQGGTWTAGRQIAKEKRPGGPPPLQIASDGTVF